MCVVGQEEILGRRSGLICSLGHPELWQAPGPVRMRLDTTLGSVWACRHLYKGCQGLAAENLVSGSGGGQKQLVPAEPSLRPSAELKRLRLR